MELMVSQKKYNIRLSRSASELEEKKKNFFQKFDDIESHNERFKKGLEKYDLEINEFSVYNLDEFLNLKTGLLPPIDNQTFGGEPAPEPGRRGRITPPASWDWRNTAGVVRAVQNQVMKNH